MCATIFLIVGLGVDTQCAPPVTALDRSTTTPPETPGPPLWMCAASGVPILFQVASAHTLPAAFLNVITTWPWPFGSPGPGNSFAPVKVATAIGTTLAVWLAGLAAWRCPASAGPAKTAVASRAAAPTATNSRRAGACCG